MKLSNTFLFLFISYFSSNVLSTDDNKDYIRLNVFNVGQGSFNTIEFRDKDSISHHIIIDCGSSSHTNEFKETYKSSAITFENKLKENRKNLVNNDQDDKLRILAVIFSHPDKDHVNAIQKFIDEKDEISHIICSGIPDQYNHIGPGVNFNKWLLNCLQKRTSIYFPIYSYEPIEDAKQLTNYFSNSKGADFFNTIKTQTLAPQKFTPINYHDKTDFSGHPFPQLSHDLSKLNSKVQLYFLAVNTLHSRDNIKPTVRTQHKANATESNWSKDNNNESLMIKVAYGHNLASALTCGDGTGFVMKQVKTNYEDKSAEILASLVCVSAHHGAETEGSNAKDDLNLIDASFYLVSNGMSYHAHPASKVIDRFQNAKNTEAMPEHTLMIEGQEERQIKTGIYSTLNSGNIAVDLYEKGAIKIHVECANKAEAKEGMDTSSYDAVVETSTDDLNDDTNINNSNNHNIMSISSSSSSSDEDDDTNTNNSNNSHKADNISASNLKSSSAQKSTTKRKRSPQNEKLDDTQNNSNSSSPVSQTQDSSSSDNDSPDKKKVKITMSEQQEEYLEEKEANQSHHTGIITDSAHDDDFKPNEDE